MYCNNCGKELPENSKFCNYCGASQQSETVNVPNTHIEEKVEKPVLTTRQMRKSMKANNKNKGCSTLAGILGVILFLALLINIFGDTDDSDIKVNSSASSTSGTVETTEPPIEISAEKLIKAYQENEINASNMYKDKYLKVTGYVDNVSQSDNLFVDDNYYVYIDYGNDYDFNDICCRLNDESAERAANLKPGDKIVLVGRCEGFSTIYVDMYDCTIIK